MGQDTYARSRLVVVWCVQAAGRGSMKRAITCSATNVGSVRSVQIGATRCDDLCEHTVLRPAEVYADAEMTQ